MRKIFKNMAWTMAATLVMAACSDSLDESDNTGQGPLTGEGYVKVAINMPSVSSTRAGDPTFADGDANEYAVKSGIIAFFEGTEEAKATFVKAYSMNNLIQINDGNSTDHVTTKVTQVLEAPLVTEGNKLYALVILNNTGVASVSATDGSLTLENGEVDIVLNSTNNSTVAALNGNVEWNLTVSSVTNSTNGFLMLNAPLYNGTTSQTLVPVTVYKTKQEADKSPATNIYVERIVAKVNINLPGTDGTLDVDDESVYDGDKVYFKTATGETLGWKLNVTNKNTKPLRDVSDVITWATYNGTNQDFIGNTAVEGSWVRIYWAKDNNYDATTGDFNILSQNNSEWGGYTTTTGDKTTTNAQYCLENTAPFANNNNDNTTAVWIKAKYDFTGDGSYDDSFFIIDTEAGTYNETDFIGKMKEILGESSLTINSNAKGGYYNTEEEIASLFTESVTVTEDELKRIGEIRYYKDGECYYYTQAIKHFGQDYKLGDDKTMTKYLGRYGVVRNNWYELTINSVSGPGEPEITPPDDEHVDDEEGYIKCTINVLSWAKRSQGVEL